MKQLSLAATDFVKKPKQTRRERFLLEMESVVPWSRLLAVIEPHYPKAGNGRRPYELPAMLRIHFMQQWFGYADPAMEEALHDIPLLRRFAGLDAGTDTMPDETTILNFRHLLETHGLSAHCNLCAHPAAPADRRQTGLSSPADTHRPLSKRVTFAKVNGVPRLFCSSSPRGQGGER